MSVKWETQQLAWSDWGNFSFNDPEFYAKAGLKPFELRDWEKIIRFLSRTWFSRLWILQEAVLGREKIVVIGSFVLKYAFIEFLVMFLNQSHWGTFLEQLYYQSNTNKESGTLGTWLLNLAVLLTTWQVGGPDYVYNQDTYLNTIYGASNPTERRYAYLLFIIMKSRFLKATDPKDRVYAPLALVTPLLASNQNTLDWIRPDYRQDPGQVYTELTTLLLRNLPNLSALSMVNLRTGGQRLGIPSWVPDFDVRPTGDSLIFACDGYNATGPWEDTRDGCKCGICCYYRIQATTLDDC